LIDEVVDVAENLCSEQQYDNADNLLSPILYSTDLPLDDSSFIEGSRIGSGQAEAIYLRFTSRAASTRRQGVDR
jgi:hypothetical protein